MGEGTVTLILFQLEHLIVVSSGVVATQKPSRRQTGVRLGVPQPARE